jgi:hypothetical protein
MILPLAHNKDSTVWSADIETPAGQQRFFSSSFYMGSVGRSKPKSFSSWCFKVC